MQVMLLTPTSYTLQLIAIRCGYVTLWSLSICSAIESVSVNRISADCGFSVTETNRTSHGLLNASLTLLPNNAGIGFLWFSVISHRNVFSGYHSTIAPLFLMRKTANGSSGSSLRECSVFLLAYNGEAEKSANSTLAISFGYNWTNDDTHTLHNVSGQAAYNIEVFTLSEWTNGDVASFSATLFISKTYWPHLVAIGRLAQCGTNTVTISYSPNSVQAQYLVGLHPMTRQILTYERTVDYSTSTVIFRNVQKGTYEVYIGYSASEKTPNGCFCGYLNDIGAECAQCGNELENISYEVHASESRISQQEFTSARFGEPSENPCTSANPPKASYQLGTLELRSFNMDEGAIGIAAGCALVTSVSILLTVGRQRGWLSWSKKRSHRKKASGNKSTDTEGGNYQCKEPNRANEVSPFIHGQFNVVHNALVNNQDYQALGVRLCLDRELSVLMSPQQTIALQPLDQNYSSNFVAPYRCECGYDLFSCDSCVTIEGEDTNSCVTIDGHDWQEAGAAIAVDAYLSNAG